MIDINILRNDPEAVRANIRKKFQDKKLPPYGKRQGRHMVYARNLA